MSGPFGSEVQQALDLLSSPKLWERPAATLPHRPDYEALTERARLLGRDVSPAAIREAFRLLMRARLLYDDNKVLTPGH
jgi:hypothetical protein